MTVALTISNLKKTYSNGFVALNGIDLVVQQGDFFALLGKNGAGKSTAIGIICSLINKSGGSVNIFGVDIDQNFALAKSYIGVVPQEINFSIFETPQQIVCNQAGYYGIGLKLANQRADHYLHQLGLWEKRNAITQTLSGGMKRRLMIARALMHQPKLLILDEPTAGVDVEIRRSMWEYLLTINQSGTTIILTTHYLEEAENLCRNIAIIDQGQIVENTSIRKLLKNLQSETYVLDLAEPIEKLPPNTPPNWWLKSATALEVEVPKGSNMNMVFAQLEQHNIKIQSMRNKTNRLEQLFLEIVNEGNTK